MSLRVPPIDVLDKDPGVYPSRIEWFGHIRFHLESGEEVVATRVVLATNGDFLEGELPDYGLWVETTIREVRKLGLPPGLLPKVRGDQRVLLALEAPADVLRELNALGATKDFDTLMDDAQFLDLAFGVERLHASYCDVLSGDGNLGVAA